MRKVLVIDSQNELTSHIEEALSARFKVVATQSPEQGLSIIENEEADLIFVSRPKEFFARLIELAQSMAPQSRTSAELLRCGNLTLDVPKLEATIEGNTLPLSVLEFNLLKLFVLNQNRVLSRREILDQVWAGSIVSNRTIDTHMVYLRKKLVGFDRVLATVYGAGYILRETPAPRWKQSAQL